MKIIMDWYLGLSICCNVLSINVLFDWSVFVFLEVLKKLDLGELLSSYVSASG